MLHRHRTRTRPATAVRRRERLVQVEVHHVDAEVARPHLAHQRVHVRAVHVEQAALGVHECRQSCGSPARRRPSVFGLVSISAATSSFICASSAAHIDHAARIRLQILDRVADHRRRRRIRPVRRIRNQHFLARIALSTGGTHATMQESGQFAVRARRGLQRDRVHAGDFDQAFAQRLDDAQRTLRKLLRLVGMPVRQFPRSAPPLRSRAGCTSSCTSPADTCPDRSRSSRSTAA